MAAQSPRVRHLNWNLLRTFLVIVEERSITKAAERLHLRQPTVTASLQKLEETLGTQLILRDSRRFVLTSRGEALRKECVEIHQHVERIGERLSTDEDDLSGLVRMLIVTEVMLPTLDRALGLMHRRHPSVTLSIDVANSQEIARAVAQRTVPFGLCLLPKPLAALECRMLMREEFGIYCGRTHPLFERQDVTLEDLRAEPFVAFTCGQPGGALEPMVALRDGAGLGARTAGVSSHLGEVARMIAAGIGIGILPVTAAERMADKDLLWRLPVLEGQIGADLYFLRNPEMALDRAEKAFLDLFLSLVPDPEGPAEPVWV
ncbi:LysR family transcriptional regulator [Methylobacterium nodulans]|uniref:Transcriptional regulator, LysR family n=1 Tax=Methylobacterium nodulans (strain LMG 21967 / CNCM I-2342 / ORS 2060) TaxID=460265 RepID=B8IXL3_METNO|nr:LysR family transcriptional regulator [Methylobacterium nodulans]ACL62845.1 transcriptional regulator, LysR family [Methylobacterium nodulans ORS 2060]